MESFLSMKNFPLEGKKVLIRVDFNVPLDETGKITDDSRIEASLPTIKEVLKKKGIPILLSHLGRPDGKIKPEYTLGPCARCLTKMLGLPVQMAPDCIGPKAEALVSNLKIGDCLLLENLRFHKAEEEPEIDPSFAKKLASLGDFYIDDAFGSAHRESASICSITSYFNDKKAPGLLMEKEITFLGQSLLKPKRPFYAIIGGSKISTKIGVIKALSEKVDVLLLGGAMAYTFLKGKGIAIGDSLYEPDFVDEAKSIMDTFEKKGILLNLPLDHIIVRDIKENSAMITVTSEEGIPPGYKGVDVGPKTIAAYSHTLKNASTVFWNGPLGVFEIKSFAEGTRQIADALSKVNGVKIVGGGDSIAAIKQGGLAHLFTHLSTGGGASLEYIEKGTLPGIEALRIN